MDSELVIYRLVLPVLGCLVGIGLGALFVWWLDR